MHVKVHTFSLFRYLDTYIILHEYLWIQKKYIYLFQNKINYRLIIEQA